jgi:4-amino-4-deoxy-L-arabinose transferase-like glycosyltransferase
VKQATAVRGPLVDLPALALVAAALAVRVLVISRGHQLDIDEADTALKVGKPIGALLADLTRDGHPPLYFLLLKGWTSLFGTAEASLRALSALFSTAACALVVAVGRRLFGRAAGLTAGALFAVSPIEIFHATEGRMYALLPLEALGAFALTERLLRAESASRARDALLLAALLVAALYTHNYGLFVPVAGAGAFALAAIPRARAEGARAALRSLALPAAVFAAAYAAYLPWVPVLQAQRASRAHDWLVAFFDATPPILAIPRSVAAIAAVGPYPKIAPPLEGTDPLRPVALPLCILFLIAGAAACLRRAEGGARESGRATPGFDPRRAALLVFPLVLLGAPWLVSVTVKVVYLVGRYDVVALPFLLIILGAGAAAVSARHGALVVLTVAFLACALPGVAALALQRRGGFSADQAEIIAAQPRSRAAVATLLSGSRMRYYLERAGRSDVLVRSFPTSTDAHPGWLEKHDPADPALAADADSLVAALAGILRPGEILWATLFDDDEAKPVLVHALARRFAADAEATRFDMALIAVKKE